MLSLKLPRISCFFLLLIVFSSIINNLAFAQSSILRQCGLKYQELKAANTLDRNWSDFLKDCRAQAEKQTYPANNPTSDLATPAKTAEPTVVDSPRLQSSSNRTEARSYRSRRHFGKLPKFTDFGITKKIMHGYNPPDFKKRDKSAREYRTRILEGMKAGPNFAGHFSIIEIGCGSSCRFAFVVNNITGKVINFPIGGEEYQSLDLKYKLNSRLIIASYQKDTCDVAYFVLKSGSIKNIKTVKYPAPENYGPCVFD
jgi:hypothetical protein